MFNPQTERIKKLASLHPSTISELEGIFDKKTHIYIDFANVVNWSSRLKWHVDLKRLKQLLDSFSNISCVKLYEGEIKEDSNSQQILATAARKNYEVRKKPVKIIPLSIDVSSIPSDSAEILKDFIRYPLLEKLRVETIKYLNSELKLLNQQGMRRLEDKKCNFDVEIGVDMLLDHHLNSVENFVLWSGDSDFADPIEQLLNLNKRPVLFATSRLVASELNSLVSKGLFIYDIQKIKDFICFPREINN